MGPSLCENISSLFNFNELVKHDNEVFVGNINIKCKNKK